MSTENLHPNGSMGKSHEWGALISTLIWQGWPTKPGRGRRHTLWDSVPCSVVEQPLCVVQRTHFCKLAHVIDGTMFSVQYLRALPPKKDPSRQNLSSATWAFLSVTFCPYLEMFLLCRISEWQYQNPTHVKPGLRKEILMHTQMSIFVCFLVGMSKVSSPS